MYDIYTKPIHDSFAGAGEEYLIVKFTLVVAHGRTWRDPWVVNDLFVGKLKGRRVWEAKVGSWHRLHGLGLWNSQAWAESVLEA